MVVIMGVELKSGLGDELAFESKHPHLADAVFGSRQHPVDFPFRDETDERRLNGSGLEIYEMLQMPLNADYQFFKIVVVRFVGVSCDFCNVCFRYGEDFEWLVQYLSIFCLVAVMGALA